MLSSPLYVQRELFCVPSLDVWIIVFGMLCATCMVCCRCVIYDDDILLSFTAGWEPLPDDGVGALGTCVAAMAQLYKLWICHLPMPVLKALAERKELLNSLCVLFPGVNWVRRNVFCQYAHNTVLLVNAKHCGASLLKHHTVTVSVVHALISEQNNPLLLFCAVSSVHSCIYYLGQLGSHPLSPGSVPSVHPPSYVLFLSQFAASWPRSPDASPEPREVPIRCSVMAHSGQHVALCHSCTVAI